MAEFTKEQLIEKLERRLAVTTHYPDVEEAQLDAQIFKIALAALTAEPEAYVDPFSLQNFATFRAGETDNKRMGREWMWAKPDAGLTAMYRLPLLEGLK